MFKDLNLKKNFGFGCMRLPMVDDHVDYEKFNEMVDAFMEAGFNYFDTAHGYLNGQSEVALKKCLTSRYPRESYILTNKLSSWHFNSQEEILPLFQSQLDACGVDYFDFYLMHSQNRPSFEKYKQCQAYETCLELKKQGKIKHFGISFHDSAAVLDEILTQYPQIEVVQIQFNYVDYDDLSIQSKLCYEVCRKHNKAVIVMEPVKGGILINLPDEAKAILENLNGGSIASYAIRYAASFGGIVMVLSGMGNIDMVNDNISYMKEFKPLNKEEHQAIQEVVSVFKKQQLIACTACNYCGENCPKEIKIPAIFASYNGLNTHKDGGFKFYYGLHTKQHPVSDCIKCGLCEKVCPQHLDIRNLLVKVDQKMNEK